MEVEEGGRNIHRLSVIHQIHRLHYCIQFSNACHAAAIPPPLKVIKPRARLAANRAIAARGGGTGVTEHCQDQRGRRSPRVLGPAARCTRRDT